MCKAWRNQMYKHIHAGEWMALVPFQCPHEFKCQSETLYDNHPISVLIQNNKMTREVEEAVERLNGRPMTSERWMEYFVYNMSFIPTHPNEGQAIPDNWIEYCLEHPPSIKLLEYLYDNHRIQVNENAPYNLLGLCVMLGQQAIVTFLVEDMKVDVNDICPSSGHPPLIDMLYRMYNMYDSGDDILDPDTDLDDSYQLMRYLLDHGADPLLENKSGENAMAYLTSKKMYFPESVYERLMTLLISYV